MKQKIQYRAATSLMLFSLLLLATFLAWFLRRVWNDEVSALHREGNLLLVQAVRKIEGETMRQFLFQQKDTIRKSDLHVEWQEMAPRTSDSLQMVTIVNEEKTIIRASHEKDTGSGLKDHLRTDIRIFRPPNEQTTGALSVMLSLKAEQADTGLVATRLSGAFSEVMAQSDLPVRYSYTYSFSEPDTIPSKDAITYFDLASKERVNIVLGGYTGYILKRMIPQIVFAIFLFGMIALAFYLIHRNLKKQQQLTALKNDFIRNITHELKTPVATVSVAIEALQHFGAMDDPQRAREYLDIAGSELNRLTLLIDKVLRMSLFEEGETTIKKERFDFRILVEEIVASMRLQFEKYQAQVQLKVADGVFALHGDRLHLASVVYNLLDNALKYSPASPVVAIHMHRQDEQIVFSVADKGQGIPEEYADKIFDKFFRVPTGDIHNIKGHGLGLSYVAGVVRQHAGEIRMNSKVGEGTVFEITLPV